MTSTISDYQILNTLGSGATATVKLARSKSDGGLYAIKIFPYDTSSTKTAYSKMYHEAVLQSQLQHNNIIKISSFIKRSTWHESNGLTSQVGAIVCELAQKGPLFDVLQASGPFEEKIALFYAQQLI